VVADFEVGIQNAALAIWPEINVTGCRFHLAQSWFRKIQNLGLVKEYTDSESEIGRWIKYLFGLPFLSPEEVSDCFAFDFAEIQPEDSKITALADYLCENYIAENSRFPPSMWAEKSSNTERTTNACESFHSRFNSNFYSCHPPIFSFIEVLKNFQTDTYIKIQSLNEATPLKNRAVRNRVNIVKLKISQLQQGVISRFEFVKCVSHFYKINL
jgi:hypothetical protein